MTSAPYVARIQRRTFRLLVFNEIMSGLGVAIGLSVGALLTADVAGTTALSGVAQSFSIIGGAVIALPGSRLTNRFGRRPALALGYLVGAAGAGLVIMSALHHSFPLLLLGMFCFGSANAAKYQARYAAVDLAEPERRGRQISWVVWASTIGAVAGPNLAAPVGRLVDRYAIPTLAAPFVLSALTFIFSALWIIVTLRPDPLKLAKKLAASAPATASDTAALDTPAASARPSWRATWAIVSASRPARLGLASMAVGHLVMVAIMSMTPIHIRDAHTASDTLTIVGIILGVHIAGMYALSPVIGWLTDRIGRRQVVLLGVGLLMTACLVAGTAEHNTLRLGLGLLLLGQGWSCTMIAGSTLLTESVGLSVRAAAQGLSDFSTGVCGAAAGLMSGVIVRYGQYPTLALVAGLATVPLLALALRTVQSGGTGPADPVDEEMALEAQ